MKKRLILLVILVLVTLPVLALDSSYELPTLKLPDLNNKTISLDNYLGKKTIVLSFFASWSKSCQEELEFLKTLAKQKDVEVLAISFDKKISTIKKYADENNLNFTILYDKKLTSIKDFKILIIPTLLVIDKSGNITGTYIDFDKNVQQALEKLLIS